MLPKEAEWRLQALAAKLTKVVPFEKVFMVSSTKGTGIAELRADLLARRAAQGWLCNANPYPHPTPFSAGVVQAAQPAHSAPASGHMMRGKAFLVVSRP